MEKRRSHILMIVLEIYLISVAQTQACPSSCACFGTTTDCRNRGLTEVPQGVPPSTTILRLSGNRFLYLGNSSFEGLPDINTLNLDRSNIEIISEQAFYGLNKLRELYLEANKLKTLPASVFEGLQELRYLYLQLNQLEHLPTDLLNGLNELRILNLGSNKVSSIPSELFNETGKLQAFHIYSNQVSSLPVALFRGLTELTGLYLQGNALTRLPHGIFDGLTKLRTLLLNLNSLQSLPVNAFQGLSELRILRMFANNLASLQMDIFDDLSNLEQLDLYANVLTYLPDTIFDKLTKLRALRMYNNPWICDCRLRDVRSWLEDNSEGLDLGLGTIQCSSPKHLAGRSLLSLSMEDLVCTSPPAFYAPRIAQLSSEGDDVILECNVTGVPPPLVYWLLPCGNIISANTSELEACSHKSLFLTKAGSLQLTSVTTEDEGTYYCAAMNAEGTSLGVRTLEVLTITHTISSSPKITSDEGTSTLQSTVPEVRSSQTSPLNVSSIVAFIIGVISAILVCVIYFVVIRYSCLCKPSRTAKDGGHYDDAELCDVSQPGSKNKGLTPRTVNSFHGQYEDVENRYISQEEANTQSGYVNRHVIQELDSGYTSLSPETSPKTIYDVVV